MSNIVVFAVLREISSELHIIIAQRRTTMLYAKNKHLGQTGDRQFFQLGLHDKAWPCIGMTFSRLVAHAADHQAAPSMHDAVR